MPYMRESVDIVLL
uniref:Uncharacterized protein n=1 Tax=Rhizophora mucronata TaxID=61149 RepID=A0A2P2QEN3_RHIMU